MDRNEYAALAIKEELGNVFEIAQLPEPGWRGLIPLAGDSLSWRFGVLATKNAHLMICVDRIVENGALLDDDTYREWIEFLLYWVNMHFIFIATAQTDPLMAEIEILHQVEAMAPEMYEKVRGVIER